MKTDSSKVLIFKVMWVNGNGGSSESAKSAGRFIKNLARSKKPQSAEH